MTTRQTGNSTTTLPLALILLLLLLLLSTTSYPTNVEAWSWGPWAKTTVIVKNDLLSDLQMNLRCKSREDDLGGVLLQAYQEFHWTFRPNIFGTTLYYCQANWGDGHFYSYDFYVWRRDHNRCRVCRWIVDERGPCSYNEEQCGYDHCYPWKAKDRLLQGLVNHNNGTVEGDQGLTK